MLIAAYPLIVELFISIKLPLADAATLIAYLNPSASTLSITNVAGFWITLIALSTLDPLTIVKFLIVTSFAQFTLIARSAVDVNV